MKYENSIQKISNILGDFFLYLFIVLTYYIFTLNYTEGLLRIRLAVIVVGAVCGIVGCGRRLNRQIMWFMYMMIFSYAIMIFVGKSGIYKFNSFVYTLAHMGVALNIVNHRRNPRISLVICYLCLLIIIFRIIILGVPIRQFMLDGSSYNYISVIGLLPLGLYIIDTEQNRENISPIAVALFVIVTFLAYGRGGIITGLTFLLLVVLQNISKIRYNLFKFIIIALLIIMILLVANSNLYDIILENLFSKFLVRMGTKEARIVIWNEFFRMAWSSAYNMIFGPNAYIFPNANLHNSFLQAYAYFGLFPFLVIIIFSIKSIILSFKTGMFSIGVFFIIFVIRASTDRLCFQGFCEMFLYVLVFYSMLLGNINRVENQSYGIEQMSCQNERIPCSTERT